MAVPLLLVMSSLAQAGLPGIVTVGPLALAEEANSVPALSGNLLIVLGLLLAVIAVRTLRSNRRAQKLLSILVLGGGLIISGIGVDRTLAVSPTVFATGAVCNADGPISYSPLVDFTLQNNCSNSIEIKNFSASCPFGLNTVDAGCQKGQVLTAGSACSFLPICNSAPP
jgi:hypothetical protein